MKLSAQITVPQLGELLVGNASRAHNRIAKQAVRDVLTTHWQKRIPQHFTRPAHGKYGYAERSPKYRFAKQKKYGSSIDLVRSGRTRQQMTTQAQITVAGTATAGTIRGNLTLRFPFPGGTQRFKVAAGDRRRVTIEQMASEIRRIAPDEIGQINAQIRERYVELVKTTTGARQRV